MRAHPTTSGPASGRSSQGPLSDLYRLWRLRPRLESSRLFWGVVCLAVLFDAAAIALAACLLFFPAPAARGGAAPLGRGAAVCGTGLVALVLLAAGRAARARHLRAWHGFYAAGLTACAAVVFLSAGRSISAEGVAGWVAAAACLAAAAGLLLESYYRHGVLAGCGAAVLSLGWMLAAHLPPGLDVVSLRTTLLADGWEGTRDLALLAGCAALGLAWAAANATLGLVVLAPHRRSVVRILADAAYRALTLAVCLLAACVLTKGLPLRSAADVGTLAALAGFALLLHARFADWVGDFGLALGCALGPVAAGLTAFTALGPAPVLADPRLLGWLAWGAVANASLAAHAAQRWYFSCPPDTGG
jgi:hypothetical protein